jgi:hypothetical protein
MDLGTLRNPSNLAFRDQLVPFLYEEVMNHLCYEEDFSSILNLVSDSASYSIVAKHTMALIRE